MTFSLQEPDDVGPIAGGDQRASHADRGMVKDVLEAALADGRLDQSEYDERLAQAESAKTFDDLVPLTRDLMVTPLTPVAPPPSPASFQSQSATQPPSTTSTSRPAVDDYTVGDSMNITAIFGGANRKNLIEVPATINIITAFGGADIDLRQPKWKSSTITVKAYTAFGGWSIIVGPDVEVIDETTAILGGHSIKRLTGSEPHTKRLVIKGISVLGGGDVKVKPYEN
jgi:hypothetical protein